MGTSSATDVTSRACLFPFLMLQRVHYTMYLIAEENQACNIENYDIVYAFNRIVKKKHNHPNVLHFQSSLLATKISQYDSSNSIVTKVTSATVYMNTLFRYYDNYYFFNGHYRFTIHSAAAFIFAYAGFCQLNLFLTGNVRWKKRKNPEHFRL